MERLVIDTETTGFSPRFNKVLTVGMLLIDIEKDFLNILDQTHIFVKHNNYNATPMAMAVNKIDIEKHNVSAISPTLACNEINLFVEKNHLHNTTLLGHNLHFDIGFLNSLFDKQKTIPKFSNQSEDTMYIWRNLQKKKKVPSDIKSSLKSISDFLHVDYTNSHDALGDCKITAEVYHKILKLSN